MKHLTRKGITLAEMMVALTIFSALAFAAAATFNSSQDSLDWNYQALSLQKELRKTLFTMTQEIRESSPSSPNPIAVTSNSMIFQIPSSVAGNIVTGWTQINYALAANNTVTRTVGGQTTSLGNDVQALSFVYPVDAVTAPRTVQIQITGSRTTLKRTITRTVTGQVVLRNP